MSDKELISDLKAQLQMSNNERILLREALTEAHERFWPVHDDSFQCKACQALSSTTPNPVEERLKELQGDKEIVDWIEKLCAASSYHIEIKPLSIAQSNAVIIATYCGSGPFQRSTKGPSGMHPFRLAARSAIEKDNK